MRRAYLICRKTRRCVGSYEELDGNRARVVIERFEYSDADVMLDLMLEWIPKGELDWPKEWKWRVYRIKGGGEG